MKNKRLLEILDMLPAQCLEWEVEGSDYSSYSASETSSLNLCSELRNDSAIALVIFLQFQDSEDFLFFHGKNQYIRPTRGSFKNEADVKTLIEAIEEFYL